MNNVRALSPAAASQKGMRLLLAAQARYEGAGLRWGWGSTVARTRRLYIEQIGGLLDALGSDNPDTVAEACHNLTIMGDDQVVYK